MRRPIIVSMVTAAALSLLAACGGSDDGEQPSPEVPVPVAKDDAKPRYIWIDASANFARYADSKENILEDLRRVKDTGLSDIVVDVRPPTGDVLYKSSHAPQVSKLDYWDGPTYRYYERSATWDYLQAFVDVGHELGLRVHAGFNTFVGGCLHPYGLGQQGMVYCDADKRDWVTVLNLATGPVNELDITTTDPADAMYHGTKFLNPCNDDVQAYLLSLLAELSQYDIDGIIMDRCRYDDLLSDCSEVSRQKFMRYLGVNSLDFATDVIAPGTTALPAVQPRYFKDWLAFRAKTIHDFVGKAAATIHGVNPNIQVGLYVGAWYSDYYTMGVNWASKTYDPVAEYPEWSNSDYHKYGLAERVDYLLIGCYAGADAVYGQTEWTMQGFCTEARKKLGGAVKFAGGPDVGNAPGFESGRAGIAVRNSVGACIGAADGYYLFDIVHVRSYDYWDYLKSGISAYLDTL